VSRIKVPPHGDREGPENSRPAKSLRYTPTMAIHPELLEILACPLCKTPVEVVLNGAGLRCTRCSRVYPVRDDIPIMLPEEATIENA
jgi:uncharacterized protein